MYYPPPPPPSGVQFVRVIGAFSGFVPTMIALCKNFGWTRVATVSELGEVYSATMAVFRAKAKTNGIAITSINSLTEGGDGAAVVSSLADTGTRITLVQGGPVMLRNLLCSAYRGGMVGREYAWLLPGTWRNEWWLPVAGEWKSTTPSGQKPCNATEMTLAASGYVSVHSFENTSDTQCSDRYLFVYSDIHLFCVRRYALLWSLYDSSPRSLRMP